MKQILLGLISLTLISNTKLLAQVKICDIRYNLNSLDNKELTRHSSIEANPWRKTCQKIGNEYDSYGNPILEKPIYAWGPTFGISNLIVYEDSYFDRWNNNLLVSTLASQKLIRIVFDEQKKPLQTGRFEKLVF